VPEKTAEAIQRIGAGAGVETDSLAIIILTGRRAANTTRGEHLKGKRKLRKKEKKSHDNDSRHRHRDR
jgi:hypothetical protein